MERGLVPDTWFGQPKAIRQGGNPFWTTIPAEKEKSRQDAALADAAQFGALIISYYQKLVQQS
jgi:hypothetical protein